MKCLHQVGQQARGARCGGRVLQHAQPLQHVLQPHLSHIMYISISCTQV